MLYSVAGGRIEVWAEPQMKRFGAGMVGMLVDRLRADLVLAQPFGAGLCRCRCCLLVAVEFFGDVGMGAQRWLDLGPVRLQPSELMKVALVMLLAAYYDWLDIRSTSRPFWVLIPLVLILVPTVLVLTQPDLGTAILLVAGRRHRDVRGRGQLVVFRHGDRAGGGAGRRRAAKSRHRLAAAATITSIRRIDTFLDPGSRSPGRGLQHHPGADRARLGRLGGQGLHAGHAVAAELPARKAHRFHLHHAGRGIRLRRGDLAAGALCADPGLLHRLGDGQQGPLCRTADLWRGGDLLSVSSRSTWRW